tara:strand:+ start:1978 stop:2301 length:324 start_codon:yes stop_codon:yes gene_type:complete
MSNFDEREKGFEAKFKHDQDLEFKIRSKRNKLIGLWAAEKLNKNESEIEEYVTQVRQSDLEKPGDDDIIDKLLEDFRINSLAISREEISKKIEEFYNQIRSELSKEK